MKANKHSLDLVCRSGRGRGRRDVQLAAEARIERNGHEGREAASRRGRAPGSEET
jgi:hypothetical protein